MRTLLFILLFACLNPAYTQTKKKQILVIGSFHFGNPGLDVAKVKTFDVMSAKSQNDLESIANGIQRFSPSKIFVEWNYTKQTSLDKFYQLNTDSLLKNNPDETVQIALRVAKKLKLKRLSAIDYRDTDFPYDSLMNAMKAAGQQVLLDESAATIKMYETSTNKRFESLSLKQILLDMNTQTADKFTMQWYFSVANRGGANDNFAGAFLVSEWYKRNLYMYSLIQKLTESKDDKVMVLLGAGHTAMLREFIKFDPSFEIVELKDLVSK